MPQPQPQQGGQALHGTAVDGAARRRAQARSWRRRNGSKAAVLTRVEGSDLVLQRARDARGVQPGVDPLHFLAVHLRYTVQPGRQWGKRAALGRAVMAGCVTSQVRRRLMIRRVLLYPQGVV